MPLAQRVFRFIAHFLPSAFSPHKKATTATLDSSTAANLAAATAPVTGIAVVIDSRLSRLRCRTADSWLRVAHRRSARAGKSHR